MNPKPSQKLPPFPPFSPIFPPFPPFPPPFSIFPPFSPFPPFSDYFPPFLTFSPLFYISPLFTPFPPFFPPFPLFSKKIQVFSNFIFFRFAFIPKKKLYRTVGSYFSETHKGRKSQKKMQETQNLRFFFFLKHS